MSPKNDKRKIHVLVIPGTFPTEYSPTAGGFTLDQAQAMAKVLGISVGVVYPALRPWSTIAKPLASIKSHVSGLQVVKRTWWTIPKFWPAKSFLFQLLGRKLAGEYIQIYGRPDIIHAHFSILAGLFGVQLARSFGVPLVVTEHMSTIMTDHLSPWQLTSIKKVCEQSDRIICVGEGLKERIRRIAGVEAVVIPNAIDMERFYPAERKPGRICFLSVGSLTSRKRMDWLIEAFHAAFPGDHGYELKIVGSGPEEKRLASLIVSLNESSRIKLLGSKSREEVASLMRNSDVFCLASSHETFGVVLIEALASDIPVIASDIEGPRDIVRSSDGILFDPGSQESLVSAMKRVIKDFPPRIGIYRTGVMERYSYPVVSEKILSVYESILGRTKE